MVDKKFLDYLYGQRAVLESSIIDHKKRRENHIGTQCCDKMSKHDHDNDCLILKEAQMSQIDNTIQQYLNIHK